MNRKPTEPDEMRMSAAKFDEMMRAALDAPPPEPANSAAKSRPKPVSKGKGRRPARR